MSISLVGLCGSSLVIAAESHTSTLQFASAIGDPRMTSAHPTVSLEGWNFCNGAQANAPFLQAPSPRFADCMPVSGTGGPGPSGNLLSPETDALSPGSPLPPKYNNSNLTVDAYARAKELYLGDICQRPAATPQLGTYSFWTVMLKSGNLNRSYGVCQSQPRDSFETAAYKTLQPQLRSSVFTHEMNQPHVVHYFSDPGYTLPYNGTGYMGFYAGTYDYTAGEVLDGVDAALLNVTKAWLSYRFDQLDGGESPVPPSTPSALLGRSLASTAWYWNVTGSSWVFYQMMLTTPNYPWLMNYLRSDSVAGGSGGQPWEGRGMLFGPVPSYSTRLAVRLRILEASEAHNQFYLPEISGYVLQSHNALASS